MKGFQCKNCLYYRPHYPPHELVYNGVSITYDGDCYYHPSNRFCTNGNDQCFFSEFIGEEKTAEDEELTYKFLTAESEGRKL